MIFHPWQPDARAIRVILCAASPTSPPKKLAAYNPAYHSHGSQRVEVCRAAWDTSDATPTVHERATVTSTGNVPAEDVALSRYRGALTCVFVMTMKLSATFVRVVDAKGYFRHAAHGNLLFATAE